MFPHSMMQRRSTLKIMLDVAMLPLVAMASGRACADALPHVDVWKDASCDCCEGWVRHMRLAGFTVSVHDVSDISAIKSARGVPDAMQSCHTASVAGYVVEGHVPAADIRRLIVEHPTATGLAVPGMPQSAPGMDQPGEPYTVMLFGTPSGDKIYAQH